MPTPGPSQIRSISRNARRWLQAHGVIATHRLTLPDFLGIGAQKSGTSWLHCNLKAHPQAFLPEPKEVHFFDAHFDRGLDWYGSVFAPGAGKIKGEITPAYGIEPVDRIRFIRATMPWLRLVFVMRDPIERAWSHAMMSLCWQVNRPFETITDAEFIAHFRSGANVSRSDYLTILLNWLSCFDRSALLIGFFEEIAQQPKTLLGQVFTHLGLSQPIDWEHFPYRQVVYPGKAIAMPDRFRAVLTDLHAPRIERLARWLGKQSAGRPRAAMARAGEAMMRSIAFGVAAGLIVSSSLLADPGIVHLSDGSEIRGEVDDSKLGVVVVRLHGVEETLPRDQVASIELAPDLDATFHKKLANLGPKDIAGRLALARWCQDATRYDLARQATSAALAIDPADARAIAMRMEIDRAAAIEAAATRPALAIQHKPTTTPAENRYLTQEQIYQLRWETLRADDRDIAVTFGKNVRADFLSMTLGDPKQFYEMIPIEQAKRIHDAGDPAMVSEVKLETDGHILKQFIQKIQPLLIGGCGAIGCHDAKTPNGKFGLYTHDDRPAAAYTNYCILCATSTVATDRRGSKLQFKLLNFASPDSIIEQYGLPLSKSRWPHPAVAHFVPAFADLEDKHLQLIADWVAANMGGYGRHLPDFTPPWLSEKTTQASP